MFREIRRAKQVLSAQECDEILARGEYGVLALAGEDDYPCAVPINYVYEDGKLYFHSSKVGHKMEALLQNPKASFCVVDTAQVVPSKYGTYYKSVIVFGTVKVMESEDAAFDALVALTERLAGGESEESKREELSHCHMGENVAMLVLEPAHISGKTSKFTEEDAKRS